VDATRLLLIRHAESEWNAAGRWQGQGDPELSATGRAQAERLAASLEREGIEVIVTSDLARARATADVVAARIGLAPVIDASLRELDVGRWTGKNRAEILAADREALLRFETGARDAPADGGESRADVGARARAALDAIRAEHAGRCVAVVTHLGVLRELLRGPDFANAEWRCVDAADLSPTRAAGAPVPPAAH